MRRCSPIPPVVPPVSRFPRCVKPRKSVITVNGLSPDANGNVNAGDVRREDFSGVEPKEKMTLNEVGAKVNEVIGRLGGAADATAASSSASVYGPGTPLGDVHPDTALSDVVEAAGMSADAVRAIASDVVAPVAASVTDLRTSKLDRSDVVDPAVATEAGKAADAKRTQEELDRISGAASDAKALAESKADKATTLAGYGITDAATKVELASKADLVGGKIPSSQLPAFVDDVLEYDAMSDFPAVGEDGKIYISKDTNLTYRWGGTQYVEISQSLALGETASTAYPGDKGKAATETAIAAYDTASSMAGKITSHIEDKGNPHAVTAEQAGAVPLVKDTAGAKTAVTIGSRIPGKEIGEHSFANGYFVNAPGGYSHAEGHETTTRGYFSHAEGESTIADGDFSHADGCYSHTRTDDTYAFAWSGDGGRTSPYPSHGPGTFNINPLGGLNGFYIGDRKFSEILANKVDKTTPYADGNFASLTADGNLSDSGKKASDFAPAVEGGYLPLSGGTVNGDTTFIASFYAGPYGDILGVTHDAGYLYKHDSVKWYYGGYDKEDDNEIAVKGDISALASSKADRPALPVTAGNLAALTADGNLADSGKKASDFLPAIGDGQIYNVEVNTTFSQIYGDGFLIDGTQHRFWGARFYYDPSGSGNPEVPERELAVKGDISALASSKADKTIPSANGNLAALTADGNLADSGMDRRDVARMYGYHLVVQPGGMTMTVDASMLAYTNVGSDTIKDRLDAKADRTSLAPEYSATSAYSVGSIVYHDGNIYQCKTAIADGGEAWNADHWELRKLDDFFTESNSLLTATIAANSARLALDEDGEIIVTMNTED